MLAEAYKASNVCKPPNLKDTGKTFSDWLKARETLHEFLTGEKIVLKDMFHIPKKLLVRTDIMPIFRPVGATNRMAMDWKVKLGMNSSYEETNVMQYKNAEGPKVPELCYINRSIKPDEDTLGDKAMSPDGLVKTKKTWTNLYGWSDADNLHFLILRVHLDSSETWTWFPDDRLPGTGKVARGRWDVGDTRAGFFWNSRSFCYSCMGARVAISIPLKS